MAFSLEDLNARDWLVVAATIAGPVLAVQAQKWLEFIRERRNRKVHVFQQLMASRRARLSPDHVQALNMIDLVFYGRSVFGMPYRTKTEQRVLDAWKEYLDHLTANKTEESAELMVWISKGDELFVNLLFEISTDVRYVFDRVQLKKGAYSPIAHGEIEDEQNAVRKLVLSLLKGETAMRMDVASFPGDTEMREAMMASHQGVAKALAGGALRVAVADESAANSPT